MNRSLKDKKYTSHYYIYVLCEYVIFNIENQILHPEFYKVIPESCLKKGLKCHFIFKFRKQGKTLKSTHKGVRICKEKLAQPSKLQYYRFIVRNQGTITSLA